MNANPEWTGVLAQNAAAYARLAMVNIEREFPNSLQHTMSGPGDIPASPRDRNPVFYGSFDWHSCVEMHWLLVRLLRTAAEWVPSREVADTLDRQFDPGAMAVEAEYLAGPSGPGRYAWGWALALAAEVTELDGAGARRWEAALRP